MSHTLGARQAQKQKTRQAFLDAALALLEEQSLSSLGLREVTRAVGVAPTAFYRHFRSIPDLGVALVDEALGSLHPMVRETVSTTGDSEERILTHSKNSPTPAFMICSKLFSRASSQVALSVSHISVVIVPRTAWAFSRARRRQL